MDNLSSIFFGILVMLLGGLLPVLITFPLEVKILQKEYFNGYYGIKPYFWARFIADFPLMIFVPFMYVAITYILNGQPLEPFRFTYFTLIFLLTSVIAQSHGVIVSAIFSQDVTTAVFLGPTTALPLLLFSGFLVRIERMPYIIRPVTFISYMRFAFEGIVISIYGFNRCGDEAVDQIKRVRKQLDGYFTNLMNFVKEGIECDNWANLRMEDNDTIEFISNSNPTYNRSNLILDLNTLKENVIYESNQKLVQSSVNSSDENGLSKLFNSLLDIMFNSKLDDNGKLIPNVLQLFELKDIHLYRAVIALIIFAIILRILSYYIIRYKANLRN